MKKLILYISFMRLFCMHQRSLADQEKEKKDPFDLVAHFLSYVCL